VITPSKWTALEPSVIRDAISGRLGFQEQFGTTYVSGATNSLALKQNPIDGSANEGDAFLYAGTTNGGVYVRSYDYQSDRWADTWNWVSEPTGSTVSGYNGAQGVASLALSPDESLIAAGRGNSSNYQAYTPSGPSLQIGQLQSDGSISWLPVVSDTALSGSTTDFNVRSLWWQQDGLYASFSNGFASPTGRYGEFGRFTVDNSGDVGSYERLATTDTPIVTTAAGATGPVFYGSLTGSILRTTPFQPDSVEVTSAAWQQIVQSRLASGELLARFAVEQDPLDPDGFVLLVGWYAAQKGNITHVDRLSIAGDASITSIESIDLSNLVGNSQAAVENFYGNYTLAFDPQDAKLGTILVGGNQYTSAHPVDAQPYASTGGFVRANFNSGAVDPVFGPYKDDSGALVQSSIFTGAPHADSRTAVTLNTPGGQAIIQADDGGVWLLSEHSERPSGQHWTSLNAVGLNSLETVASDWDARSNSFVAAFQDNATSIGQLGHPYMHNVWAGDGNLALMDDAPLDQPDALSWVYLNSQKYMVAGAVRAFALDEQGRIDQAQALQLTTNWQGNSVQPVQWVEVLSIIEANPGAPLDTISGLARFKSPATTNPYRQGDIVLAGQSSLYETFVPNWSDAVTADGYGSLELVPVLPYSDANTTFTAVNLGSSTDYLNQHAQPKPVFWDSLMAASWDQINNQGVIWYRDPVVVVDAPPTLAEVDKAFLDDIRLVPLAMTDFVVGDVAYQLDTQGGLATAYWIEVGSSLAYGGLGKGLQPGADSQGAALVIYQDGELTRLPYASTPGLNQLVQPSDIYGPTALEVMPAASGEPALLVIGGEHGLFAAELDAQGIPGTFEPMNIDGLADGVQAGRAIMGVEYNPQDDLLIASLLGGGSLLFSRSGVIGDTPASDQLLHVSQTTVPQAISETLDKRGNPVSGNFVIELAPEAFDDAGIATVEFVIEDADLWRSHLDAVTFYLDPGDSTNAFDLLDQSGSRLVERLTFYKEASMRLGMFQTSSTAAELPAITLPYTVNLFNADNEVVQSAQSSINLMPNGATPTIYQYDSNLLTDRDVFQTQFGSGDGVEFQKIPFAFKVGLPSTLPQNTELFLFEVDGTDGQIELDDGTIYAPTDPGYLEIAVPAALIPTESIILAGPSSDQPGLDVQSLQSLFFEDDLSAFLSTEEVLFGVSASVQTPLAFGPDSAIAPLFGFALKNPDGTLSTTTVDVTSVDGNQISVLSNPTAESFVLDVGYGGIFAAQHVESDIQIAKLGELSSAFGFVRVDDLFGTIDGLQPGNAEYVSAALQRSLQEGLSLDLEQGYGSLQSYQVDGFIEGVYYASFITPGYQTVDSAFESLSEGINVTTPQVLFSFDQANVGADNQLISAAVPFANDLIAFEDMPLIGDRDFNDIAVYYGGLV